MVVKESNTSRTVIILQRILPHYRVEFFDRLSRRLIDSGIRLRVIYGQEKPGTVPRSVYPDAEWAEYVPNRYWSIGGLELVWQGGIHTIEKSDLTIVEQANRLLVNYLLLASRLLRHIRLAYWGHGKNLQITGSSSVREWMKLRLMRSVDWWFAYTQISSHIVESTGYPRDQITIVQNSIDTEAFSRALNAVTAEQISALRDRLGLGDGKVALYCGGMYPDKQLPFLLRAAARLQCQIKDFRFILIGSGPDEGLVREAAEQNDWMHYLGAVYGAERAEYFAVADVMLMPGLVGLAIVDSFIAGLPIITTDVPIHSPEIAYLENGVNGIMTSLDINDYVSSVADCLRNNDRLEALKLGCRQSAGRYTLDAMVSNFADGIMASLPG